MTIDEAIRVTEEFISVATSEKELYLSKALKLGIEALQFFKGAQREAGGYQELRLSSETKD